MGTFQKGILGGFSGTVGTVVGGNWKGIDYMRSKGSPGNRNPSEAQLAQQLKFAMCIRFLQTMTGLVEVGFSSFAIKKTGANSALSYLLQNAVAGVYPTYNIVYADVLISRGDLPNVLAPTAVAAAASLLNFSWTNNTGVGVAKATDKAILAAYCPAFNQCIYTTGSADRSALTDSLDLSTFAGQVVETYIGFMAANGKNVATSIYTGQVTIS